MKKSCNYSHVVHDKLQSGWHLARIFGRAPNIRMTLFRPLNKTDKKRPSSLSTRHHKAMHGLLILTILLITLPVLGCDNELDNLEPNSLKLSRNSPDFWGRGFCGSGVKFALSLSICGVTARHFSDFHRERLST